MVLGWGDKRCDAFALSPLSLPSSISEYFLPYERHSLLLGVGNKTSSLEQGTKVRNHMCERCMWRQSAEFLPAGAGLQELGFQLL